MKKVTSLFLIILISCTFLSGCFSYRDINKLMFVITVVVDIDKDNRPVIYIEAFKPFRSSASGSEQGQRILLKGTGKTTYEALRDIHLSTSYKLNYTQNKALIFTTKAAKYGIDNWLDIFDRHQEFVVRPYIAVTDDGPEELLKLKAVNEEYLGIVVRELIDNEGASVRSVRLALNEYLNKRLIGSKICVVTMIGTKKNTPEESVEIEGGAILKEDKMVDILPRPDGQGYNFLMNTLKTGSLEVSNPDHPDQFISLNVLRSNTKTEMKYDGKEVKVIKTINVKTNITEIEKSGNLNDEFLAKLNAKSVDNIERACKRVFEKYKQEDLDIFELQEQFKRRYPKEKKVENVLKVAELEVVVNENIEGSPDTQDFWD